MLSFRHFMITTTTTEMTTTTAAGPTTGWFAISAKGPSRYDLRVQNRPKFPSFPEATVFMLPQELFCMDSLDCLWINSPFLTLEPLQSINPWFVIVSIQKRVEPRGLILEIIRYCPILLTGPICLTIGLGQNRPSCVNFIRKTSLCTDPPPVQRHTE